MPELASLQNNGKETMNKIFALNVTVIWLHSNKKRKSNNCIHSTHDKHRAWRTVFERWQGLWTVVRAEIRKRIYPSSRRVMVWMVNVYHRNWKVLPCSIYKRSKERHILNKDSRHTLSKASNKFSMFITKSLSVIELTTGNWVYGM